MKKPEILHILSAIVILTFVSGFAFSISKEWNKVAMAFGFSAIIIIITVAAKKLTAYSLDSNVEHEIWMFSRYGFHPHDYFKKPVPAGLILPFIISIIFLGTIKMMTFLTYETHALKHRAAKRFGFYSFTEMTDWHNGVIGAAGILSLLLLSFISYILPASNLEYLARMSAYYAFWNLLPISKLDGTQILFGSRVLWAILFTLTSIFCIFSIIIP